MTPKYEEAPRLGDVLQVGSGGMWVLNGPFASPAGGDCFTNTFETSLNLISTHKKEQEGKILVTQGNNEKPIMVHSWNLQTPSTTCATMAEARIG